MNKASYLASMNEVRSWLESGQLDHRFDVLIKNGYDDLDSLSRCNTREMGEFLAIFDDVGDRAQAQTLLEHLRASSAVSMKPISLDAKVATDSTADKHAKKAARSPTPSRGSGSSTGRSETRQFECRAAIHCPDLYGHAWVERLLVLDRNMLWCFPSSADMMPEFSVNLTSAKTVIKQRSLTVTSVEERGGQQILMDFGDENVLLAWMRQIAHLQRGAMHQRRQRAHDDEQRDQQNRDLLYRGATFKKIKNTAATRRRVWCTVGLDKLMWGIPGERHDVRGFIRFSSITAVNADMKHQHHLKLFIEADQRTLTLEVPSLALLNQWYQALKWALDRRDTIAQQEEIALQDPEARKHLASKKRNCEDLLRDGAVFRKFKHGSPVSRRVLCTPDMSTLQWREERKGKIKGQVAMQDIAYVEAGRRSQRPHGWPDGMTCPRRELEGAESVHDRGQEAAH